MKKTVFLLAIIAVLATGCKKKETKSTALNYNGTNPIEIVLRETQTIKASSDYDISYSAINYNPSIEVITLPGDGKIYGKNVGNAALKMDNGYESKTVDVKVSLFREPTFEFGCRTGRIRELYGAPLRAVSWGDTILLYQYTSNQGYSYACGELRFYFEKSANASSYAYTEADVYINPEVEFLMNNYLEDNFVYDTILGDTMSIYHHKLHQDVFCGKFASHNDWNEWVLFYIRANQEKSVANILKRRPRSSKFLY